jgi:hypothetical protein
MKVGIQGTSSFSDYQVFLRAMRVVLSDLKDSDTEFIVFSAGPAKVNSFAMEFVNITERTMRSQGIKSKIVKVPPSRLKDLMRELDYFAFFSLPKEPEGNLLREAQKKDVECGVFRF